MLIVFYFLAEKTGYSHNSQHRYRIERHRHHAHSPMSLLDKHFNSDILIIHALQLYLYMQKHCIIVYKATMIQYLYLKNEYTKAIASPQTEQ